VNTFEVAVLRILIKRQQPLKLSDLISGFPDDCEDSLLSAISSLKLHGYIMLDDYQPDGYVSINRDRRKEILLIVDSDIYSHNLEVKHTMENHNSIPIEEKNSFGQVIARYSISQRIRTIAISSLLIVGLVIALGSSSIPTTSPDTEFAAYHHYIAHKKWSSAYGADDHDGNKNSPSPYAPPSASLVALKDCNQKQLQHQKDNVNSA
jgi:hypothetical protein